MENFTTNQNENDGSSLELGFNFNRKHKSSVFSTLFGEPNALRDLYSAIEGVDIPQDAIIDINTLSDALYMGQINDVSFTINNRIVVLIEHQSSINENIPTRLLMYIGRVYEKIINRDKLYQRKLMKIPKPEFIVLYNGKENFPEYKEYKLSDAFIDAGELKKNDNSNNTLELKVKAYNINHGHNKNLLEKSQFLGGYSVFIDKIREFNVNLSLEESVKMAIKYCVKNDILKQFLRKHGSEVINMLYDDISVQDFVHIRVSEAVEDVHEEYREKTQKIREKAREEAFKELDEIALKKAQEIVKEEYQEKIRIIQEETRKDKMQIARNLLAEGSTPEFIQKITGLSLEEIELCSE